MKKCFFPAAMLCAVLFNSCTKDQASLYTPPSCGGISSGSNTYSNRDSVIFLTNCAKIPGCHGPQPQEPQVSGVDLTNYTNSVSSFQNYNGLCSVTWQGSCTSTYYMPYGLPKLPDSLITYIQCWVNNNYPH